jgi:hypothetical protein
MGVLAVGLGDSTRTAIRRVAIRAAANGWADVAARHVGLGAPEPQAGRRQGRQALIDARAVHGAALGQALASLPAEQPLTVYLLADAGEAFASGALLDLLVGLNGLLQDRGTGAGIHLVVILPPAEAAEPVRAAAYASLAELCAYRAPSTPLTGLSFGPGRPERAHAGELYRRLWLLDGGAPPLMAEGAALRASQWILSRMAGAEAPAGPDEGFSSFGLWAGGGAVERAQGLADWIDGFDPASIRSQLEARLDGVNLRASAPRLRPAALRPLYRQGSGQAGRGSLAALEADQKAVQAELAARVGAADFWDALEQRLLAREPLDHAVQALSVPAGSAGPLARTLERPASVAFRLQALSRRRILDLIERLRTAEQRIAGIRAFEDAEAFGRSRALRNAGRKAAIDVLTRSAFDLFDYRIYGWIDARLEVFLSSLGSLADALGALERLKAACRALAQALDGRPGTHGLIPSARIADAFGASAPVSLDASVSRFLDAGFTGAELEQLIGALLMAVERAEPGSRGPAADPAALPLAIERARRGLVETRPGPGQIQVRALVAPAAISRRLVQQGLLTEREIGGDDGGGEITLRIEVCGLSGDAIPILQDYQEAFSAVLARGGQEQLFVRKDEALLAADLVIPLSREARAHRVTVLVEFARALVLGVLSPSGMTGLRMQAGPLDNPAEKRFETVDAAFSIVCGDARLFQDLQRDVRDKRRRMAGDPDIDAKLAALVGELAEGLLERLDRHFGRPLQAEAERRAGGSAPPDMSVWSRPADTPLGYRVLAEG